MAFASRDEVAVGQDGNSGRRTGQAVRERHRTAPRSAAQRDADAVTRVRAVRERGHLFFTSSASTTAAWCAQADPQARGTCWKLIGSVVAAAVLLIGVLLPSAYGLLAGLPDSVAAPGGAAAGGRAGVAGAAGGASCFRRRAWKSWRASSSSSIRRRRRWCIWTSRAALAAP